MEKAILYLRVSSKEQEKEGYSLDAQEKLAYEYAKHKGLEVVKVYKVSESAYKKDRYAFGQMIEYTKKHSDVNHLIFDVIDRMTRNDTDKVKIYDLIKDFSKTIHFSRNNKIIDKNSKGDDEFMTDIHVAIAKKYSSDISNKASMGMTEKAEQGLYPSWAPCGYQNNHKTRTIEIENTTAPIVRRAFELIASGSYSLLGLETLFYDEGIRTKKGNKLLKSTLYAILTNPIYYGSFYWNDILYKGSHEPIISKQLFDSVQAVLGNKNPLPVARASVKRNFAFNNLITCGQCNCKVLGEIKKERFIYYHCTFSKGRHENRFYIPENKLDECLFEALKKTILPDEILDWVKATLKEDCGNTTDTLKNRLDTLKNERLRLGNRLDRLYDDRLDGKVDEGFWEVKANQIKNQIADIDSRLRTADAPNRITYETAIETLELGKKLIGKYKFMKHERKHPILKFMASNYILDGKNLNVIWREPYSYIVKRGAEKNWLGGVDSNHQMYGPKP